MMYSVAADFVAIESQLFPISDSRSPGFCPSRDEKSPMKTVLSQRRSHILELTRHGIIERQRNSGIAVSGPSRDSQISLRGAYAAENESDQPSFPYHVAIQVTAEEATRKDARWPFARSARLQKQ
jgi:hypothetical protein